MGFFILDERLSHATCSPVSPYFRVTPKPHEGPKTNWVLSIKYTDSESDYLVRAKAAGLGWPFPHCFPR